MIGIVIVTHGGLAEELSKVLNHMLGSQPALEAICLEPDDDIEQYRDRLTEAVQRVDQGKGVIILSDMFGGTPSNLSISLMHRDNVEVIAGVNLPLLVKLCAIRGKTSLQEAAEEAQNTGRKYINAASQLLKDAS